MARTLGKETKRFADSALRSFLEASDSAREQARGDNVAISIDKAEGQRRAKHAWSALQRARIFAVHPATYAKLYRRADIYTTETLAKLKWTGPDLELVSSAPLSYTEEVSRVSELGEEADPERLMVACSEAGRFARFPSELPFDAIFLSYGRLGISLDSVGARTGVEGLRFLLEMGYERFALNGHLLWMEGDKGYAYSFVSGVRKDDPDHWHCMLLRAYEDGEWDHAYDLDPWTVPALISAINEHRAIHTESNWTPGQRLDRNKRPQGSTLPLPKPYYLVQLSEEAVGTSFQKHVRGMKAPREFSHRFDVRGHECVRVLRGAMPMDPEVQERLLDRGYRIYADKEPLSEDHARVTLRKIPPKRDDEWMAILVYWRDPHVKGPEGKPYIPAMRVGV